MVIGGIGDILVGIIVGFLVQFKLIIEIIVGVVYLYSFIGDDLVKIDYVVLLMKIS